MLTSQLQLKRLQFLDVLQDEAAQAGDDLASLFDVVAPVSAAFVPLYQAFLGRKTVLNIPFGT